MKSKKPTVVILYGPIAVGKLTVARILVEKLGYKLAHNHAINDMVSDVFPRASLEYDVVVQKMRFTFLRQAVKAGASLVITHCYAHDFVNKATGLSDPDYVKKQKKILTAAGAQVCIVHLKADVETLLQRITGESRKEFKKLKDPEELARLSKMRDWQTSAPVRGQLILDTTNFEPEKTAEIIINYFNLK